MNPDRVAINPPTRVRFDRVRADEILIVVMVLLVWAGAVYIFFNQWGEQALGLGAIYTVQGEPTELPKNVCTWLREISSCSCLPVLPGPAWVLLSKVYILFLGTLYKYITFDSLIIS